MVDGALSVLACSAGTDAGKILRKPQQAFTSALELAWFDELDTSFKLLPSASMARAQHGPV